MMSSMQDVTYGGDGRYVKGDGGDVISCIRKMWNNVESWGRCNRLFLGLFPFCFRTFPFNNFAIAWGLSGLSYIVIK